MKTLRVAAKTDNLAQVLSFVREGMEEQGALEGEIMKTELAVEEIFVNIASYAYAPSEGEAQVLFRFQDAPRAVRIEFSDWGTPYDPLRKADPNLDAALDDRPIGGLGIFMTKKLMDEVSYRYEDGMNILTIQKNVK